MSVKIRLWGSREEIAEISRHLHHTGLRILSESRDYPDRGSSTLWRRYLEVEVSTDGAASVNRGDGATKRSVEK